MAIGQLWKTAKQVAAEFHPPVFEHRPFEPDRTETLSCEQIKAAYARFDVLVNVDCAIRAASCVTYRLRPLGATTIRKISSRLDDVALCLGVPGATLSRAFDDRHLGLEVPVANRSFPSLVNFQEIAPQGYRDDLPVACGIDGQGQPLSIDLSACPHMLVAGTTGSGKSVFLNSLLCSLLYACDPHDLNLVLIDPKQVEFAPYHNNPFLAAPVCTDASDAFDYVHWLVGEMERRYSILKKYSCLNISQLRQSGRRLDRIVVVIDEFADLILMNKHVEVPIVRLAQKGRAAGIHLVVATQRPVVKVITGLIKANIPVRVSFRVTTGLESRIILDQNGAEHLLGKGDMLMVHPDFLKPVRVQAPFISSQEVRELSSFWVNQKPTSGALLTRLAGDFKRLFQGDRGLVHEATA